VGRQRSLHRRCLRQSVQHQPATDGHSVLRSSLELHQSGSPGHGNSIVRAAAVFPGGGVRATGCESGASSATSRATPCFFQSQGKGLRVLTQPGTALRDRGSRGGAGFPRHAGTQPQCWRMRYFNRLIHDAPPRPVRLNLEAPWEQFDGAVVTTNAKFAQPPGSAGPA